MQRHERAPKPTVCGGKSKLWSRRTHPLLTSERYGASSITLRARCVERARVGREAAKKAVPAVPICPASCAAIARARPNCIAAAQAARAKLVEARSALAKDAVERLDLRLSRLLRRARLGRIESVLGRKRALEVEVEALAAGVLPQSGARFARSSLAI